MVVKLILIGILVVLVMLLITCALIPIIYHAFEGKEERKALEKYLEIRQKENINAKI